MDGTCRIQTVTEKQNKHYYELIKEFKKEVVGDAVLFNEDCLNVMPEIADKSVISTSRH